MRTLILILISILTLLSATAQTTQKGIVQEYNEKAKKTPLEGVELNIRSANNTVSDKSGNFSLQFLTLKPGEKVNVRRIEKLGYEIFNKEAIEQWNINPTNPFIVIMCRSDKFKKIRDNYEKVSSESYARQLKKEEAALLKLKEQGKLKEEQYQKQLFELRENYEKQLDNLDSYVDRFSRIDLSELSVVEQEIISLVQEGKIDEAIAKYEQQNYVDKYTQEVAEIKEVSSAIDRLAEVKQSKEASKDSLLAAINRQIETLKLAGGKDNFDKIEVILKDIAYADTTNFDNMYKYGKYLEDQNQHVKAIEALSLCFRNCQNDINKAKVAIGICWALMGNSQHREAEDLINEVLSTNANFDNELHGNLFHTKASSLFKQTKFQEAKIELQNALDKLSGLENSSILPGVYFTFSSLNRTMKNFDEAILYINKAISSYENMNQGDGSRYLYQLTKCKSSLGKIYYYSGLYEKAKEVFINLDKEYAKLYNDNPIRFAIEYAWNKYMNAKNYLNLEDFTSANSWLNESLGIIEDIYQQFPFVCGKEYVQILQSLGYCNLSLNNTSLADEFYEKASLAASYLYETLGDSFKTLYLQHLYANAYRLNQSKRYEQSICENLKALNLCESLYIADNKSYGEMYTSIMMHIADAYHAIDDSEKALNFSEKALDLRSKDLYSKGAIRDENLAAAYRQNGSILSDLERYEEAISSYEKAYNLYSNAIARNFKYNKYAVAMKRNIAAIYSEIFNNHEKAIDELKLANDLQPSSISILEQLGVEYLLQQDKNGGLRIYKKILLINPEYTNERSQFNDMIQIYL